MVRFGQEGQFLVHHGDAQAASLERVGRLDRTPFQSDLPAIRR